MIVESKEKQTGSCNDILLSIPPNAGRKIVEVGAVIACPLLGTDQFVRFCSERGLSINRERLLRLEHLGLFAPIFRVRTPEKGTPPFYIPVREDVNWFEMGWAWDTTGVPLAHEVPDHEDQTQEGYYSIFQINYLYMVLQKLTVQIRVDSYLGFDEQKSIGWHKDVENLMESAKKSADIFRKHEHHRCVALLCQFVSNRYFPMTQTDQRMMNIKCSISVDRWMDVCDVDFEQNSNKLDLAKLPQRWYKKALRWQPQIAERLFHLTPAKLRHAYVGLATSQELCDPLANWYQLTQFISTSERLELKGDALRAETLRVGAYTLRLLYESLYKEELPLPNEIGKDPGRLIPEISVRNDTIRYLELVVNRYSLNPRSRLLLIVEGECEKVALQKIFESYFGRHQGKFVIEIFVLGGVNVATGSKKTDRFRAILLLMDYLHSHQTLTFLILDNENRAKKLKDEARKAKSNHSNQRNVTRSEYIHIWKKAFEFDNFSCTEIASAMNKLAPSHVKFTVVEVRVCKDASNSGSCLQNLYKEKAYYGLNKIKLSEVLVANMLLPNSRRKIRNRPIIKILEKVVTLALRNPFPTTSEVRRENLGSKYFGKKRKPKTE